jgi:uncharacterized 2Fe-2S/4Fe-4S cluster protein (DUF4445 family)
LCRASASATWSAPNAAIQFAQRDVRELQFAKAAIATGWRILLEEAAQAAGDTQQVLLADSLGSYQSRSTRSASGWCATSRHCAWWARERRW